MAQDGVEITPADLRFRFQLNKQLLGTINLNNTSDKRLAFKIKTTAPKKYVVRPSSGIAEAKSSVSVQVIMQAQKDYPPDFQNCKDKFMVQTVLLSDGEDVDKDAFNKDVKKDALKESRLRVILEGPASPPSPVPESNEHDEDVSRPDRDVNGNVSGEQRLRTAVNDPAATTQENSALKARLEKLTQDRDQLRKTLDQVQLQRGSKPATADPALKFKVSIVHVILVAIMAFLLGYYL